MCSSNDSGRSLHGVENTLIRSISKISGRCEITHTLISYIIYSLGNNSILKEWFCYIRYIVHDHITGVFLKSNDTFGKISGADKSGSECKLSLWSDVMYDLQHRASFIQPFAERVFKDNFYRFGIDWISRSW